MELGTGNWELGPSLPLVPSSSVPVPTLYVEFEPPEA